MLAQRVAVRIHCAPPLCVELTLSPTPATPPSAFGSSHFVAWYLYVSESSSPLFPPLFAHLTGRSSLLHRRRRRRAVSGLFLGVLFVMLVLYAIIFLSLSGALDTLRGKHKIPSQTSSQASQGQLSAEERQAREIRKIAKRMLW